MQSLRAKLGYTSLKTLYTEDQARNYPSLNSKEDAVSQMNEDDDSFVPMNPIELKDKEIATLRKNVEESKAKDKEVDHLKEALTKATAELKVTKKNYHTSQQKLNFTKKATEKVLVQSISDPTDLLKMQFSLGCILPL